MKKRLLFMAALFVIATPFCHAQHTCGGINLWVNGTFEDTLVGMTCSQINPINVYYIQTPPWNGVTTFINRADIPVNTQYLDEPDSDHTTGTSRGHYFYADPRDDTGWTYQLEQTIKVQPNTNYTFSAWLLSMLATNDASATAHLRFAVNGVMIAGVDTLYHNPNVWKQLSATWNSDTCHTAVVSIDDYAPVINGNDFAVDDIYFGSGILIANAGPDISTCSNTPFNVGGNPTASFGATCDNDYTYQWTWSPLSGITLNNDTIANPRVTISIPQNYQMVVTVTDLNGNSCPDTVKVAANSIPGFVVKPVASSICSGQSDTLTASGGGGIYTWAPSTALSATTGASVIASPTTTVTYTVTTSSAGCTAIDTAVISVNKVSIKTGPNPSLCEGDSVSLQAIGANKYTWSPSGSLRCDTCSTTMASPTVTTTYTIIGTTTCAADTVQTIVTVNSNPVISASPNPASYCPGESSTLTASGGSGYTWSPVTDLSATTGSSITANPTVSTTYTVIGTNSSGCSASDTVSVTVNPGPSINAMANPPSYCSVGSSSLTASGGATYTWTPSTGLNATSGSMVIANPTITTNYTVTGVSLSGCTGTNEVTVTVNPNPTISVSASPPSYCTGGISVLTASGANNYTWSPSTGLTATTGGIVAANPTVTTTYVIIGTNAAGCQGVSTVTVIINTNALITVTPSPVSYCPGGSSVLTASGGSTYTWSPSIGLSATTGRSVLAKPTATTVYTITGDTGNCTGTTTDTVTVDSVPPLLILPQPPPLICFNFQSDTLRVATKGSDFTWSPSEGLSATTGATVIANPSVSVTYTVTGIDSLGCLATGTEPVTILQIANRPTFSQHGDTLISSSKYDNQWYLNNTLLLNDTSQDLIITQSGNYYVEINNEANGCSTSSDTLAVTGINQLTVESGQLTVYPNPFSNQLTIISNRLQINEIDVANELGQVLLKVPVRAIKSDIDLSNLSSGIYFITVINKSGRDVVPVVKLN